ncbi:YqjF family protein [Rasiella sp. SM2506]|uniref:YqjF family protein n=1 Tax=Rasiella sp. SM2506 TaxID=3423914 RepID=UPI003D7A60E9
MSFLTAEWRRLALANYKVDPAILEPYLPYKTELDIYNGICYASLVGFMFKNVRVLGLKIPGHVHFEEVNLRFYVRCKEAGEWKRGVVFVKEIVPKHAISFVANTVYNEVYETRKMNHIWEEKANELLTTYNWKNKKDWFSFSVTSDTIAKPIPLDSETEFITEHYWGYNKTGKHTTTEYQVTHPKWNAYDIKSYKIKADFAREYGENFRFLNDAEPISVMLAEGSSITIEGKSTIR